MKHARVKFCTSPALDVSIIYQVAAFYSCPIWCKIVIDTEMGQIVEMEIMRVIKADFCILNIIVG